MRLLPRACERDQRNQPPNEQGTETDLDGDGFERYSIKIVVKGITTPSAKFGLFDMNEFVYNL